MNCNEFRKRLLLAVESQDAAPTERDQLRQHAHDCPDAECRQLWADDELLAGVVPEWRRAIPQVSLTGRVLTELGRSRTDSFKRPAAMAGPASVEVAIGDRSYAQPPAVRFTRSWVACAASVACLLLLVPLLRLAGQPHLSERTRQPGQPIAAMTAPAEPTDASAEPAGEQAAVSEMIRTYAGVPQTATEFVTDTVVLLLPEDLSDPNEAELSRPAQWRGRLSEQLEPWGRELGTAFDAFLETVSDPPKSSRFDPPRTVSRSLSA